MPIEFASRSIAGSTAVITGAASGMGRATALLFASEGARVVLADRSAEQLTDVAREVEELGATGGDAAQVLAVECDVRQPADLEKLVTAAVDRFGGIDLLVNNAGVSRRNNVTEQSDEEFEDVWQEVLDINLTAHVRLVRSALPHLKASDAGRIVNIASTEALVSQAGLISYSASKSGVVGITRSMAIELAEFGITANAICPGPIETGMTSKYPEEAKAKYARRRVPMRRYGRPEEVAQMTLNLCLPASSYVTGTVIPVDGGMSMFHV
ncbi:SDR family NAD(P)-dependent oxidoreductase [Brevibacterium daeguense]|uniref:SDR family NAD(P)-dependent oxidoreductase n=1 Tax=Brevibacterium daeguense TaxID=909936 RepID=A0ABP8EK27_9MICO|nr:SDR family NAD(P)-dependent oxidoreductase [Brevibacterium daeguense]